MQAPGRKCTYQTKTLWRYREEIGSAKAQLPLDVNYGCQSELSTGPNLKCIKLTPYIEEFKLFPFGQSKKCALCF